MKLKLLSTVSDVEVLLTLCDKRGKAVKAPKDILSRILNDHATMAARLNNQIEGE